MTSRTRQEFHLERGLYVFRYESAADPTFPPVVYVRPSDAHITIVRGPGEKEEPLRHPGSNFVVRADHPGTVLIDVVACVPSGSIDADVKFEAIGAGADDAPEPAGRVTVTRGFGSGLSIKGHLASLGDVAVEGGQWLSGPDSPARIEALAIKWRDGPDRSELRYGILRTGDARGKPIKLASAGNWIGTKGRGEAIVALVLDLKFAGEPTHQVAGEALFLGSRPQPFRGQTVELKGQTGREPLVGLKLDLEAVERSARPAVRATAVAAPAPRQPAAAPSAVASSRPAVATPSTPAGVRVEPANAGTVAGQPDARSRVRVFRA